MTFQDPLILLGLLVLLPYGWFLLRTRQRRRATIGFSSTSIYATTPHSWRRQWDSIPDILRLLALLFFIISLARPITGEKIETITSKGIEIMMCLDVSDSMRAMDLEPNRLEVAKKHILSFIRERSSDRIGLVIFGEEAFLQCPLTLDHRIVEEALDEIDFADEVSKSTAIGMAIATGIHSLKNSQAKTKIIVILTDGVNNAGDIDPITAAELCKTYGIKVYTIGMGKPGVSSVFVQQNHPLFGNQVIPMENRMDEDTLKAVAALTEGTYFNVQDDEGLSRAYQAINQLEKVVITSEKYLITHERYHVFLMIGFMVLLGELMLRLTAFRRIP